MRVMVKVMLDTEKGSEAIRSGRMPELMKQTLDRLKPEAAYYGPEEGRRTCFFVVDMKDSSELPPTAEPFFTELGAKVEIFPVMNNEDLERGLSKLT
ncbi:hypothetical protein GCM10027074_60320 [Streptomyces deserti]